jgi:ribonuclease D
VNIAAAAAARTSVEHLLPPRMSPRRQAGLIKAVHAGLALPVGQHPEILRHKFHRPTEAEMRRYHELEKRRNHHAHHLGIDPTLIASRATLSELARDWEKHAPEMMNWQRELLL